MVSRSLPFFSEEKIEEAQRKHKEFFDKGRLPKINVNWSLFEELVKEKPMHQTSAADEIIRYIKPVYESPKEHEQTKTTKVNKSTKTSTKKGKGKSE